MSVNTFASHASEIGAQLKALRGVTAELELLLSRHTHNDYSSLLSADFDTEQVTKLQYDAAMTSINNLLNTWLPAGNGTSIDQYLYGVPEVTP